MLLMGKVVDGQGVNRSVVNEQRVCWACGGLVGLGPGESSAVTANAIHRIPATGIWLG